MINRIGNIIGSLAHMFKPGKMICIPLPFSAIYSWNFCRIIDTWSADGGWSSIPGILHSEIEMIIWKAKAIFFEIVYRFPVVY